MFVLVESCVSIGPCTASGQACMPCVRAVSVVALCVLALCVCRVWSPFATPPPRDPSSSHSPTVGQCPSMCALASNELPPPCSLLSGHVPLLGGRRGRVDGGARCVAAGRLLGAGAVLDLGGHRVRLPREHTYADFSRGDILLRAVSPEPSALAHVHMRTFALLSPAA